MLWVVLAMQVPSHDDADITQWMRAMEAKAYARAGLAAPTSRAAGANGVHGRNGVGVPHERSGGQQAVLSPTPNMLFTARALGVALPHRGGSSERHTSPRSRPPQAHASPHRVEAAPSPPRVPSPRTTAPPPQPPPPLPQRGADPLGDLPAWLDHAGGPRSPGITSAADLLSRAGLLDPPAPSEPPPAREAGRGDVGSATSAASSGMEGGPPQPRNTMLRAWSRVEEEAAAIKRRAKREAKLAQKVQQDR